MTLPKGDRRQEFGMIDDEMSPGSFQRISGIRYDDELAMMIADAMTNRVQVGACVVYLSICVLVFSYSIRMANSVVLLNSIDRLVAASICTRTTLAN